MNRFYFYPPLLLFSFLFFSAEMAAQQSGEKPKDARGDIVQASRLYTESKTLLEAQRFDEALEKAEKALNYASAYGHASQFAATIWKHIGTIRYEQGRYTDAVAAFDTTLKIQMALKDSPIRDFTVMRTCRDLGDACSAAGDKQRALALFQQGFELAIWVKGEYDLETVSFYSALGRVSYELGRYDEAIAHLEHVLAIYRKVYGQENEHFAMCYSNIGVCYNAKGLYRQALDYLRRAADLCERLPKAVAARYSMADLPRWFNIAFADITKDKSELHAPEVLALSLKGIDAGDATTVYTSLGDTYRDLGEYDKAVDLHDRALSLISAYRKGEHPNLIGPLNNLGLDHSAKGDEARALEYHRRALSVCLKFFGADHPYAATFYNNIGTCYNDMSDADKAIEYHEKSLGIRLKFHGAEHPSMIYDYNNLGKDYEAKGNFQKALELYEKAAALALQALGEEHPSTATLYANLGVAHHNTGNYKRALEYNERALAIQKKLLGETHPHVAATYDNQGETYRKQGAFAPADTAFQHALKALRYAGRGALEQVNSAPQLAYTLSTLAALQRDWYGDTRDTAHLTASRQYYREALAALDYHSGRLSPAAKSSAAAWAARLYAGAIATDQLLYQASGDERYRRESFGYAERSKAFLLYEALRESDALRIAGIPDSLLRQERDLRLEIAYYDKRIQEKWSPAVETDTAVLGLFNRRADAEGRLEALKKHFEAVYPDYFRAKYALDTVSVEAVQRDLLRPGQSLVEYAVGDSNVFIFLVQREHFEVLDIKKDFPLEQWVKDLTQNGLYGHYGLPGGQRSDSTENASIRHYTRAAAQLYDKLISPLSGKIAPGSELIIVPDGVLGYVPFEALLTQKPEKDGKFSQYRYLLHEHPVSYSYSATLLREMRRKQGPPAAQKPLLAMAPFFLGDTAALRGWADSLDLAAGLSLRDQLNPLKNSGKEVAAIAKISGGTPLYGADASADTFQKLAPYYRILHLSTHGKADDRMGDYAYLAFGMPGRDTVFGKLYARDMYNISLHAELVVLSACETGTGRLQRGEGIVSLARAFAYAGARSLVTSLWKVDDKSTSDLMVAFYRHLKAGKNKDEALRRAKLDYLKNNKGSALHPFYWAGFIGIGDMRSLGGRP